MRKKGMMYINKSVYLSCFDDAWQHNEEKTTKIGRSPRTTSVAFFFSFAMTALR